MSSSLDRLVPLVFQSRVHVGTEGRLRVGTRRLPRIRHRVPGCAALGARGVDSRGTAPSPKERTPSGCLRSKVTLWGHGDSRGLSSTDLTFLTVCHYGHSDSRGVTPRPVRLPDGTFVSFTKDTTFSCRKPTCGLDQFDSSVPSVVNGGVRRDRRGNLGSDTGSQGPQPGVGGQWLGFYCSCFGWCSLPPIQFLSHLKDIYTRHPCTTPKESG